MKTALLKPPGNEGFSLMVSIVFLGIASVALGSILMWSETNARLAARNNEYQTTIFAAESAFQKVRSSLINDYANRGEPAVWLKLSTYQQFLPSSTDDPHWANYEFTDPATGGPVTHVAKTANNALITMEAPYTGLTCLASKYQVIANVRNTNSPYQIPITIGIEMSLGNIPLFQFAMFAEQDLEINPGPAMVIGGVVHGNRDIYIRPGASLVFSNDISSTGTIYNTRKPNDGSSAGTGTSSFQGAKITNSPYQHLPAGTNQISDVSDQGANVHAILDIPPAGEPYAYNTIGTNRYYNKADLILKVTDSGIVALSGVYRGNSTQLTNFPADILNTSESFYDKREGLPIQATALDVGKLKTFLEGSAGAQLRGLLGGSNASTLFIADLRSTTNAVITTNYALVPNGTNYSSQAATNVTSPTSGYLGSITNVLVQITNTTVPAGALNVTVNSASSKTTTYYPASGTYVGTVQTNYAKKGVISGYTYNAINTWRYDFPEFAYARITATNLSYTTNSIISTNFPAFAKPAIVLTNGAMLPNAGLTIATPDPVYIKGDYNISDSTGVSSGSDTRHTRPAAVLCDAINILSRNFVNSNSFSSNTMGIAATTTVNTAVMAGNVPSGPGYYSGGMENFFRFLEDWTGKTSYYNGSMVLMFPSQIATGRWQGSGVYKAPNRVWALDPNYSSPDKLPPSVPQVSAFAHGRWMLLPPGSTTMPN